MKNKKMSEKKRKERNLIQFNSIRVVSKEEKTQ